MDKRTYKDRAQYNIQAVAKRRRKIKAMAIEYKGGKCSICGYNKYAGALDFHHIDESTKKFDLSTKGLTRSWERTKTEIDKCILVCANCHREIHAGLVQLPVETRVEK
ncbi:TPA: HNH endonuclease [Candidatus Berkelbacteria bacterium]|uniref:HNH endonuclease n=1 Tax=Berkelbacteria bacterium GW2011_GWE1_39_12 TaxID=1618337 RepID=A0A0G4B453_9BACT|nr:MAG: HNH endonuclease [Berkelbacteria bacterium GW2011_GWE1_39_12]HBO60955.1 HNH endonuclease [Candidatus Berkelbacteria bacterium]